MSDALGDVLASIKKGWAPPAAPRPPDADAAAEAFARLMAHAPPVAAAAADVAAPAGHPPGIDRAIVAPTLQSFMGSALDSKGAQGDDAPGAKAAFMATLAAPKPADDTAADALGRIAAVRVGDGTTFESIMDVIPEAARAALMASDYAAATRIAASVFVLVNKGARAQLTAARAVPARVARAPSAAARPRRTPADFLRAGEPAAAQQPPAEPVDAEALSPEELAARKRFKALFTARQSTPETGVYATLLTSLVRALSIPEGATEGAATPLGLKYQDLLYLSGVITGGILAPRGAVLAHPGVPGPDLRGLFDFSCAPPELDVDTFFDSPAFGYFHEMLSEVPDPPRTIRILSNFRYQSMRAGGPRARGWAAVFDENARAPAAGAWLPHRAHRLCQLRLRLAGGSPPDASFDAAFAAFAGLVASNVTSTDTYAPFADAGYRPGLTTDSCFVIAGTRTMVRTHAEHEVSSLTKEGVVITMLRGPAADAEYRRAAMDAADGKCLVVGAAGGAPATLKEWFEAPAAAAYYRALLKDDARTRTLMTTIAESVGLEVAPDAMEAPTTRETEEALIVSSVPVDGFLSLPEEGVVVYLSDATSLRALPASVLDDYGYPICGPAGSDVVFFRTAPEAPRDPLRIVPTTTGFVGDTSRQPFNLNSADAATRARYDAWKQTLAAKFVVVALEPRGSATVRVTEENAAALMVRAPWTDGVATRSVASVFTPELCATAGLVACPAEQRVHTQLVVCPQTEHKTVLW